MKFISAKIASSIRDRYGISFKLSSVDEGKEPVGFKIMIGLEKEGESSVRQTDLLYAGTEEDLELLESLRREKIRFFKDEIVDVFKSLDSETPILDLLQAKDPTVKEPKQTPYCKYCGGTLAKGESICHVCGNKVI